MNAEFFDAVADIEKEKGIPREYMYEKIRQAMLTAFRKDTPDCEDNVEVILDETKKKIEMVVKKTVVARVIDPYVEISEEAAHRISKRAKIGDVVSVPVETKQFGRIAAQAAKQVIIQGIREAERGMIYEEFNSKEHEILTGVVNKIDPRTGCAFLKVKKTVVARVIDPYVEISEEAAHRISKRAKIGDVVSVPVETKQFGRIAAQAAKQVIIQGIREAERGMIYEEFNSKEHEILTGVVNKIDPRTGCAFLKISSNSDYTEAMLAPAECIRGEVLHEGDRIKVYVVEVRNSTRGPQVLISRTHPGLVKRLFELEVPEIFDGTVEIKSIAREAGSRTKMAVWAEDPVIDPIGACVGPKGGRVASVVNELGGEKIDIVKYSEVPEEFIAAALAPSEVLEVTLLDEGKSCRVIVPDNQLSLAIGKEGQNARLAAKLTGYKIDIKPESEA